MGIDPSLFQTTNVADTCGVWNVLSSSRLSRAAFIAKCHFVITAFVNYECLYKPRRNDTPSDVELKSRLVKAQREGRFRPYACQLEDLQAVALLQNRKRLGKGELSTIAFAMKYEQAVFTDDQKARKLAAAEHQVVQTTPHLFSWLIFTRFLVDADKDVVINEHKTVDRPLAEHLEAAYQLALHFRLAYSTDETRKPPG
jgi:hypothetical protein